MKENQTDLIKYRLFRASDTFEDALLLAEKGKWNSTINRLYYAAYYAIMALLISNDLKPTTHNGAKSNFNQYFVKTNKIDKDYGRIFSQLFTWRHKGDYDDLFDFTKEKVEPIIQPVKELIDIIENLINKNNI